MCTLWANPKNVQRTNYVVMDGVKVVAKTFSAKLKTFHFIAIVLVQIHQKTLFDFPHWVFCGLCIWNIQVEDYCSGFRAHVSVFFALYHYFSESQQNGIHIAIGWKIIDTQIHVWIQRWRKRAHNSERHRERERKTF